MNDAAPRTNGETYFFRDHGQFDLLRLRVLPELIGHRKWRSGSRNEAPHWSRIGPALGA